MRWRSDRCLERSEWSAYRPRQPSAPDPEALRGHDFEDCEQLVAAARAHTRAGDVSVPPAADVSCALTFWRPGPWKWDIDLREALRRRRTESGKSGDDDQSCLSSARSPAIRASFFFVVQRFN
jgi:hypothetical protein